MEKPNVTTEYPPIHIYNICVMEFKANFKKGTVFTYGDKIHSYNKDISDPLYVHEMVHVKQQKEMGADVWWDKYLSNKKFRLEQELEAYRTQFKYVKDNYSPKDIEKWYKHIVECMSSPLYGKISSKKKAGELLLAENIMV